ncbi:RagB/SusD family nutrient uptake outer membrane protein [Parapedobacter sp. SGR-10]|nr:RagB/SusD family nutrient uptake outer membrane protein [Parapedobacter sp. SGR-10]
MMIDMKKIALALLTMMGGTIFFNSCSKDFLKPDPLSFYEPALTFTTEEGLQSVLAFCDRHIKLYYAADHGELLPIGTEYMFSDLMVSAATDRARMLSDMANELTPTSLDIGSDQRLFQSLSQTNSIWHFWHETYYVIMQANTVIQYVDDIETLDEETKNMYKGRAYFHRAFRYLNLVFQFGDVPLLTKVAQVPKLNYRSTKRDAILQMITQDMEQAVEWVPEQSEMKSRGMVNKGACRMLLTKCYLALGEFEKAKVQTDILIDQSGYALITGDSFGTFNDGGEPRTWPITRNIIWDMHRAENKLIAANREVILGIPNRGSDKESFTKMVTMRILYPFLFDTKVKTKDGKQALLNLTRSHADYNPQYDYMRAMGRGIATWRPTYFQTHDLWKVNGRMDETDLRHSSAVGNWIRMEDYRVNNKASSEFGNPLTLRDDSGNELCSDTIRRWFDVPHYKFYLDDPVNEANINSNGYQGATNGGIADWYLYRLAEAYLLRAEAKFYLGDAAGAADDVNEIRKRAKCTELYQGTVTIGDIMDERARELYWEEWRNVELTRVSLCLARSGKPDEWGNTYNVDNFDKQQGTDPNGGSYWYQRIVHHSFYNKYNTPIIVDATGKNAILYTMDKKNIYWPIFSASITANSKGRLAQNYGYDGYDPATPKWETWEEAIADEDNTGG